MRRRDFMGVLGGLIVVPTFGRFFREGSGRLYVPAYRVEIPSLGGPFTVQHAHLYDDRTGRKIATLDYGSPLTLRPGIGSQGSDTVTVDWTGVGVDLNTVLDFPNGVARLRTERGLRG